MEDEPKRKRVRQSCVPCRNNKTRCDGQKPCEPCHQRGIVGDCHYALTARQVSKKEARQRHHERTSPNELREAEGSRSARGSPHRQPLYGGTSTETPSMRASSHYTPGDIHVSQENSDRWIELLPQLPPKVTCEILLAYLVQECDMFIQLGDVVPLWLTVIERQACSAADAGRMCAALSLAALCLHNLPHAYYQPPLPRGLTLPMIRHEMYALARTFLPARIVTLDELELLCAIQDCMIQSSSFAESVSTIIINETACLDLGLLDENSPQWQGLSAEARERRRRLFAINHRSFRFIHFEAGRDFLSLHRVNTCRPTSFIAPYLKPISLNLNRDKDHAQMAEDYVQIHRIKTPLEVSRTNHFLAVFFELLSDFAGRIRSHIIAITEHNLPQAAIMAQGQILLHDLRVRRTTAMPAAGFPFPAIDPSTPFTLTSLRHLSQCFWIHSFILHMEATSIRPWAASTPDEKLGQEMIRNALQVATMPAVFRHARATKLFMYQNGLLVVPYFNAAVTLMSPILKAAQARLDGRASHHGPDMLLHLDESFFPLFRGRRYDSYPAATPMDASTLRHCAQSVLELLDALRGLEMSPLGKSSSEKVGMLVERYKVRDHDTLQLPVEQDLGLIPQVEETTPGWTTDLLNDQLFYELMTQSVTFWDQATAAPHPPFVEPEDDLNGFSALPPMPTPLTPGPFQIGELVTLDDLIPPV